MEYNIIENDGNTVDRPVEEAEVKPSLCSRFFRGTVAATIAFLFVVFVNLLLYFSENTGA